MTHMLKKAELIIAAFIQSSTLLPGCINWYLSMVYT